VVAVLSKPGEQSILTRLRSKLIREAVADVEGVGLGRRYAGIGFVAAVVLESALAWRQALGLQSALLAAKIFC
jgi:hypothetical protein